MGRTGKAKIVYAHDFTFKLTVCIVARTCSSNLRKSSRDQVNQFISYHILPVSTILQVRIDMINTVREEMRDQAGGQKTSTDHLAASALAPGIE